MAAILMIFLTTLTTARLRTFHPYPAIVKSFSICEVSTDVMSSEGLFVAARRARWWSSSERCGSL